MLQIKIIFKFLEKLKKMLRSILMNNEIKVDENGKFFVDVSLKEGVNELKFSAIDKFGNSKDYFLKINP